MLAAAAANLYSERVAKANFAICRDCFWCASVFGFMVEDAFPRCPQCGSSEPLDMLPISYDEFYTIYFGQNGNLELHFEIK